MDSTQNPAALSAGPTQERAGQPVHVVIVSYNWPPRNASGTHRPYSWARRWSQRGARVTVLTAEKYAFDGPLDLNLPALPGIELIEVGFMEQGKRRLAGLARALGRKWTTRLQKLALRVRGRTIDVREGWRGAARPVALRLAAEADVLVSTFGPATTHLIASDMKAANPGLRWIADYRDPWSGNVHGTILEGEREQERKRELATIAGADLLTTVSQELADNLADFSGKSVHVIENGFDLPEERVRAQLAAAAMKPPRPLRIVHTGLIYPGLRDPRPLLEALARMSAAGEIAGGEVTCDFFGNRLDALQPLAADLRFAPFIHLHGHVPRDRALQEQRDAGLLLLLETGETRGTVPAKVYEYMTSGTPILSIGSLRDSAVGKLLAYTGAGVCVERDVETIGRLIAGLLSGDAPEWFRPDVDRILEFSRERRADRMFNLITASAPSVRGSAA